MVLILMVALDLKKILLLTFYKKKSSQLDSLANSLC